MAPGGGTDKSAKHVLDEFGQQVYKEVKKEADGTAKKYIDDLKGKLQEAASTSSETVTFSDTCQLVEDYYNNHVNGVAARGHPCESLSRKDVDRFSNTLGGQCTKEKISGSTSTCGACAPYRRLHLCHHNLEKITDTNTTTTHNLLAEVCYAAKEEGASITGEYPKYQDKYGDLGSTICTVLARSFADIGDIVRGKDLFYGNTHESAQRDKLDKKLKTIFGHIYEELKKKNGKNVDTLQARYKDGKDPDFFKLREDWWTANRHTVWEAITCNAWGYQYFRPTCNDDGTSSRAINKCRCKDENGKKPGKAGGDVNIVPTYFDYVPQFLRWFQEWAEDFCRLRKRKLKDAKSKCRRPNDKEKYCDLNRYDCERTASGKHDFFEDDDCKDCQYSCAHFVNWIDNQKLEFLKQRNKYQTEISNSGSCGGSRKKRSSSSSSSYDNGYENKFYNKLKKKKNKYVKVGEFLDLLSKETTCTKNGDIEEEGTINFKTVKRSSAADGGDGSNKTFYRTKYCEACPWCGAQKKSNGGNGWEPIKEPCGEGRGYNDYKNTNIPILTGDTTKSEIVERYRKFCKNNGKNGVTSGATPNATSGEKGKKGDNITETWKCYYYKKNENGSEDINFCVQGEWKQFKKGQKVKSYNAFFWDWVHDMLHDSLEWRERLNSCINNNSNGNTCRNNNKCKTDCGCFEKWVERKKEEWKKIKEHFDKQENIPENCYFITLEYLFMNDELLKNIKDTHANAEDIERIGKMLEQAGVGGTGVAASGGTCTQGPVAEKDTTIDKFLQEELKEAEQCKQKQNECNRQSEREDTGGERAGEPRSPGTKKDETEDKHSGSDSDSDSEGEEEEQEGDDDEDDGSDVEDEPAKETTEDTEVTEVTEVVEETVAKTTTPSVEVCKIVDDLFKETESLNAACSQKYGPKAPTGWKCVTPSGEATGKSGATTGGLCIPPRRRRLYVGKLT
ncbi:hypothetical protein PFTANZ_06529, partial [Plasmodium falciparum Tanzania (2000708)]